MPAAKKKKAPEPEPLDEFTRVTTWRFDRLRDLGLTPDQAIALIEIPDVVHKAKKLADAGMPPAMIAHFLEGD